ncbi:hypothetical protein ACYQR9_03740 [Methylobacterium sp. CM6241]
MAQPPDWMAGCVGAGEGMGPSGPPGAANPIVIARSPLRQSPGVVKDPAHIPSFPAFVVSSAGT